MPRAARKKSESGFYHVLLRGIDKKNIFEDDEDRYKFLKTVVRYKDELNFELNAYCLMDNHVHLLIRDVNNQLDLVMKKIESSYVYYFNLKYERSGHLFQDRFKSEPVEDDEYFLTVLRYIMQNPEKAGICRANKYKWSSYQDYVSTGGISDMWFALGLFDDMRSFIEYIDEDAQTTHLENGADSRLTDAKAQKAVADKYGADFLREVASLSANDKYEVLDKLRHMGLSVRQIARLTGINRGVIQRNMS